MTWSKIHTSTVVTQASGGYADSKRYEQWAEIFSWLTGRGWTVTERTGNSTSNEHNYWRLEKTVTTYEGASQTLLWNFRLSNAISSASANWFNGRAGDINAVGTNTTPLQNFSGFLPDATLGGVEFWQSDEDNDSYMIVTRTTAGVCQTQALFPGENSYRTSGSATSATFGPYYNSIYPVWGADQMRVASGDKEMGFGEVSHAHGNHSNATPVITHGELHIHDEASSIIKWRQADVSTLEDFSLARLEWNSNGSSTLNTRIIDGTYYIQLGDQNGCAVALLDTGSVNPNMNA